MSGLGASEKKPQNFVEFRYGDPASPTYTRYTDWTFDTTFQSVNFVARPELKIESVQASGVLDDADLILSLKIDPGSFEDRVSKGIERSRIFVTVWEQVAGSDGSPVQVLTLFRGRIFEAARNDGGRMGWVRFKARSLKQRLEIPLGIPATDQCPWQLGGRGCGVAITPESGTLTVVSGKTVTITGLAGHVNRYWNRGYISRLGHQIMIRDWLSGTSFELAAEPPADWVGQAVTVVPGCDKSKDTCNTVWGNLANFGGIGLGIPIRHPSFETEV